MQISYINKCDGCVGVRGIGWSECMSKSKHLGLFADVLFFLCGNEPPRLAKWFKVLGKRTLRVLRGGYDMNIEEQLESMIGEWVRIYVGEDEFLVEGRLLREGERFTPRKAKKDEEQGVVGFQERWEVKGKGGTALFNHQAVKSICNRGVNITMKVSFNKGEKFSAE